MDPDFGLFDGLECEESTKALDKPSKRDKKNQKEVNYIANKPEARKKMNLKRKEKFQEELKKFSNDTEKRQYLDGLRLEKKLLQQKGLEAQKSKLRVVIDCSFEESMEERENRSLAIQLSELYFMNRSKTKYPARLIVANIYPTLQKYLDDQCGSKWAVTQTTQEFYEMEELKGSKFIYLSPDATEELDEVDENVVYVVGGLVDRMIVKDATNNRANLLSSLIDITPKRLPISDFIKKGFKKALNVSTAALMIPEYLEHRNWEKTFNVVVPNKYKKEETKLQTQNVTQTQDFKQTEQQQQFE